jgi:glycosyltransferase involved in cell wall biosynthesis
LWESLGFDPDLSPAPTTAVRIRCKEGVVLDTKASKNVVEKKRVAFLINSMVGGGAEKLVQLLLEQLTIDKDLEIVLILLEDKITYQLPKGIEVIPLFSHLENYLQKFFGLLLGALKLRKITIQYKISATLSLLERSNFVNVLARLFGSPHRAIISEHTNPQHNYHSRSLKNSIAKLLLKVLYGRADKIIAVSGGVKKTLINAFRIKKEKIQVIHDPCDINKIEELSREQVDHPWFNAEVPIIITVGRLVKPKGQWHLIQAFAKIRSEMHCRLVILGEGELRNQLEQLSKDLGIDNDVGFLRWQENPYKYMARSTVFAFPSIWEGFGIVLVEAMACGIPVVSFDCESGPSEILKSGEYGLLVPVGDEGSLAKVIVSLLRDNNLRERFAQKARERVQEFTVEDIAREYRKCLLEGSYFSDVR